MGRIPGLEEIIRTKYFKESRYLNRGGFLFALPVKEAVKIFFNYRVLVILIELERFRLMAQKIFLYRQLDKSGFSVNAFHRYEVMCP
jgi:hypothetical protein